MLGKTFVARHFLLQQKTGSNRLAQQQSAYPNRKMSVCLQNGILVSSKKDSMATYNLIKKGCQEVPTGQGSERAEVAAVYVEGRIHDQVQSPLHLNSSSLGGHKACTSHNQIGGPVVRVHPYAPYGTFPLPPYHFKEVNKQMHFRDSVSLTHIYLC